MPSHSLWPGAIGPAFVPLVMRSLRRKTFHRGQGDCSTMMPILALFVFGTWLERRRPHDPSNGTHGRERWLEFEHYIRSFDQCAGPVATAAEIWLPCAMIGGTRHRCMTDDAESSRVEALVTLDHHSVRSSTTKQFFAVTSVHNPLASSNLASISIVGEIDVNGLRGFKRTW